MEEARLATHGIALVEFHHQQPVRRLGDIGAVGMHREQAIGLAQIGIAVVRVLHHEARIVFAGHRVVVGRSEQIGDGGAELHEIIGVGRQALQADGESAVRAGFNDRVEGVAQPGAAGLHQGLRDLEPHERHVFQVLDVDVADGAQETLQRLGSDRHLLDAGMGLMIAHLDGARGKTVRVAHVVHGDLLYESGSGDH
ncbi:hypothetical protein FQZ97_946130 [compost metagenome]